MKEWDDTSLFLVSYISLNKPSNSLTNNETNYKFHEGSKDEMVFSFLKVVFDDQGSYDRS